MREWESSHMHLQHRASTSISTSTASTNWFSRAIVRDPQAISASSSVSEYWGVGTQTWESGLSLAIPVRVSHQSAASASRAACCSVGRSPPPKGQGALKNKNPSKKNHLALRWVQWVALFWGGFFLGSCFGVVFGLPAQHAGKAWPGNAEKRDKKMSGGGHIGVFSIVFL
jgi:hypothetical protein